MSGHTFQASHPAGDGDELLTVYCSCDWETTADPETAFDNFEDHLIDEARTHVSRAYARWSAGGAVPGTDTPGAVRDGGTESEETT